MSRKGKYIHSTHIEICPYCKQKIEVENKKNVVCPICGNEFYVKNPYFKY